MTKEGCPEDDVSEVFELAARLQVEQVPEFSRDELAAAAAAADIQPGFVDAALQQIRDREQRAQAQRLQARQRLGTVWRAGVVVGAAGLVVLVVIRNALASADQQVELAWAQVETQFQRRSDLIPNLVAVTERGARQQRQLVVGLNDARRTYLLSQSRSQKIEAAASMDAALHRYAAQAIVAEAQAGSQLYLGLQDEIAGTENRIATERRRYNMAVNRYNQAISMFPASLVARLLGFRPKPLYAASDSSPPRFSP